MKNPKSKYYKIPNKSQNPNPNEGKIFDIRERTFVFASRILEIADMIPKTSTCDVIRNQLVKAGTSIGANTEEADGAVSKRDFTNKMVIARKEAKETKYWLRLIQEKYINLGKIDKDLNEAQEIINILSSIISKTKE